MRFYHNPDNLEEEVNQFEKQIDAYQEEKLDPVQFKGIRVAHGVYEQRERETYMMRIRVCGGVVTPLQLRTLAEISIRFKLKKIHVTTRQAIQIHSIALDNIIEIYRTLISVGLSSRGSGGNTIRNITCPHDSGINPVETFDVAPYAGALTTRLISEQDSWDMPRKLKIAFSNSDEDVINFTVTCLAFVAKIVKGKKGFKVYCGGGLGTTPKLGKVILDWVPEEKVYYVARAIKSLFDKHGNRRIRTKGKIKWLVEKLGKEKFVDLFNSYYQELIKEPGLELQLEEYKNISQVFTGFLPTSPEDQKGFRLWKYRYTGAQKQPGLFTIRVPLHLGDIQDKDALRLAETLENFGENTIRFSISQDIHIRNIPEAHLGTIYSTICQLDTRSDKPELIANFIACTGAANCSLGIALSRKVAKQVQSTLLESELDLDQLKDIHMNFSGCPHSCGNQYTSDIGFAGRVGKEKHDMYAAYSIFVGGSYHDFGSIVASKVEQIATKHLPDFVVDLLTTFLKGPETISFKNYIGSQQGISVIKELAEKYRRLVPTLLENEGFYHDWEDLTRFTLLKGRKAECSAGLFDLIEIDFAAIDEAEEAIKHQHLTDDQEKRLLQKMVFHSVRALLITRGAEPSDNNQVYESFDKYFIQTGIVDNQYSDLIQLAKTEDFDSFSTRRNEIFQLADYMRDLYKGMDESLRFKSESTTHATLSDFEETPTETKEGIDLLKDFRGVQCPMNFVKTKIALSQIKDGQLLEVYLDDGQPIDNVPRSLLTEGHLIVEQTKLSDKAWSVVIQKN